MSYTSRALNNFLPPFIILGVGVLGFWFLQSLKAGPDRAAAVKNIPRVHAEPIRQDVRHLEIEVEGVVMPLRKGTPISAEVSGRIMEKGAAADGNPLASGMYVEQETVLYQIEKEPFELELQRVQNELAQVNADLAQLELEETNTDELIVLANEDLERVNRELERVEQAAATSTVRNIITASQLDAAKGDVTRMKNALLTLKNTKSLIPSRKNKLEAQKTAAETRQRVAERDLELTTIVAPLSGVIDSEPAEAGEWVQAGTQLLVIQDESQLEVSCELLKDEMLWITAERNWRSSANQGAGQRYDLPPIPVTIRASYDRGNYFWQGTLSRMEGTAMNEMTRTLTCRVRVNAPVRGPLEENPVSGEIVAEPYRNQAELAYHPDLERRAAVTLTIHVPVRQEFVRIPEEALRMHDRIYTTTGSGDNARLHVHTVNVVHSTPGEVLTALADIQPPLNPGAQIVVSPLQVAQEGMQVTVTRPDSQSSPADQEVNNP